MIYHCQYHVQTVIIHPDKRQALNHNTTNHHQHSDGVNKSLGQSVRVIVLMRLTKSLFSLITSVNMWGTMPHPDIITSARNWKSSLERERRLVHSVCSGGVCLLPIRVVTSDKSWPQELIFYQFLTVNKWGELSILIQWSTPAAAYQRLVTNQC